MLGWMKAQNQNIQGATGEVSNLFYLEIIYFAYMPIYDHQVILITAYNSAVLHI
jgi:hypothetical protein